jgi:riboflavin-specific deaminase-like protein
MSERPFVLLSCAMSIDGYIDDASETPLPLSNEEDFDRVDEVRAWCDAILVGANTIRRDNPRLVIRSPQRRAERVSRGLPENPVKVTLTASGDLDPSARFFTEGPAERLVYAGPEVVAELRDRLAGLATVVDRIELPDVLRDLASHGVRRLMVEGGTGVNTRFLTAGLVDELHIAVAPVFVGDLRAPRFVHDGRFGPVRLAEARPMGDVVLLRYLVEGAR